MKTLALLAALATIAISLPLAHAEPRSVKPTWIQRKVVELRTANRALHMENRTLRRQLRHRGSVREALRLASIVYGVPPHEFRRVVRCESNFMARAKNPSSTASGAAQLLTSTFAATPYRGEDIFSPYANLLAAGWLWKRAGWTPWVCRP